VQVADTVEQPLTPAREDWPRLISISSTRPATRYCLAAFAPPPRCTSLPPAACRACSSRFDAIGDERERRTALEFEWLACMMGEHEHRVVERRVLSPPVRAGADIGSGRPGGLLLRGDPTVLEVWGQGGGATRNRGRVIAEE